MATVDDRIAVMPWSPLEGLMKPKRTQFRFTDGAGNQGFILYHSDNGVDIRIMIEHAYFFPNAAASATTLSGVEKAT